MLVRFTSALQEMGLLAMCTLQKISAWRTGIKKFE